MNKIRKSTLLTFLVLIIVFIFLILQFSVPKIRGFLRGGLFLIPIIIFSLLGLILLILSLKNEEKKKIRNFLILTGSSSFGFFIFILLHNFFYMLNLLAANIFILNYFLKALDILFFFVAIFLCPFGFLIGLIFSIYYLVKN